MLLNSNKLAQGNWRVREARKTILQAVQRIIKNDLDIIEGARLIWRNWDTAGLGENDLYYSFSGFASETDHIPRGDERKKYDRKSLEKLDYRGNEYIEFYKESIIKDCRAVVKIFQQNDFFPSDNYKALIRNTAQKMLKDEIDIIEGIREILGNWEKAEFEEDDLYYCFAGLDTETKNFPKGNERQNVDPEVLKKRDEEEAAYLKKNKRIIEDICQDLINFCEQNIVTIPDIAPVLK